MESKVRKGMESANWTKTSPKKGKSSPWNAMMTTAPTEQVDFPTQLILHLIIYSPWVELDYHSHVKRVFEFAVICKAPIHNFPSLRKASLKIFQFRLWDLRPRANARDQLRPWQQIATSPSQVESILPHYRFWDNVTWLELDPFISGPRTVNLCKFWLDLAFECKRPDWKKKHTQNWFATSYRILEAICWGYDIRTSLWDMGVVKLPVTLLHVPCCNQWNIKFWWVPVISFVLVSN